MGELFSPAQLHASVCAAALFLGATDAQVPAGATTTEGVRNAAVAVSQTLQSVGSVCDPAIRLISAHSHALR